MSDSDDTDKGSNIDAEIVTVLCSTEDSAARTLLIQEIRVKFEKIARYKGVHKDDVDDVVNDGIEKLFIKLPNFHGRGSFNGWVCVMFGNHCTDYFRRKRFEEELFVSGSITVGDHDKQISLIDVLPDVATQANDGSESRQQLDRVLTVIDRVIKDTADVRRHGERDAEIARLGLKELFEPKEILVTVADRFPGLSLNAIRMVLHAFRAALREEVDDE